MELVRSGHSVSPHVVVLGCELYQEGAAGSALCGQRCSANARASSQAQAFYSKRAVKRRRTYSRFVCLALRRMKSVEFRSGWLIVWIIEKWISK
ncbi:unnamed protein product [Spodoptera littoralis]|uniref:Uncharacterized protein n=1 Tax=Spodoptera littoralis TaxID=7109 RepID=A0A9P0IDN7_SPOLI|nr:unnamed protein product [Spodoptera littoralis]CAH1645670.1 unnamed protein product [Spodoptera littoralis]